MAELAKMTTIDSENMDVEQITYNIYLFLCTKEYYTYCGNPFDEEVISLVLHHFSFV